MATEREEVIEISVENIRALNERIKAARADGLTPDNEPLQLQRIRTLSQLIRQHRLLTQATGDDAEDTRLDNWRRFITGDYDREAVDDEE
ncbi:hypothetical protein [Halobaculum rarum]|uniref:hypothetical protein n=1 Tax=Halobaculum rarum TaxID=3075122 RepID=UPI0032B00D05